MIAYLSPVARSAYGDILRLLKDDMVANVRGALVTKLRGIRVYWYAAEKTGRTVKFWYIGPDSTEIRTRVTRLNELREQAVERKQERVRLARLLRAEGTTPVDRGTGGLLLAMAKVGTFRLGGTLIGAVEPSLAETFSALKFDPVSDIDRDSVWWWRQSRQTGMPQVDCGRLPTRWTHVL